MYSTPSLAASISSRRISETDNKISLSIVTTDRNRDKNHNVQRGDVFVIVVES
jgi:hypothetical protein